MTGTKKRRRPHPPPSFSSLVSWLMVLSIKPVAGGKGDIWSMVKLTEEETLQRGVCLDGSAPVYYWRSGWGSGKDKFFLHYEGGGWCATDALCLERSSTLLGSSKAYPPSVDWNTGVGGCYFSNDSVKNPLLYNWNSVVFKYCDGSSFASNVADPVVINGTTIYYRGKQINDAFMKDLIENRGMREASEVVVSGCSAGGAAVYLHIDNVARVLEGSRAKVRGLADSGFFVDWNINGGAYSESIKLLVHLHNITSSSASFQDCVNKYTKADEVTNVTGAYHCFSPQHMIRHLRTPVFSIMSKYDVAQITADNLSADMHQRVNDAGEMMEAIYLDSFRNTDVRHGWLLDGCLHHCFWTGMSLNVTFDPWNNIRGPSGRSQREMFEAWYKGRPVREESHGVYPCTECCRPGSS